MSPHDDNEGSSEQAAPLSPSNDQLLPDAQEVERPQFGGFLHLPAPLPQSSGSSPAVIALPDPDEGIGSLDDLIVELLEAQITVLAIYWTEEPTYPEILAKLPGAIAFLTSSAGVDPDRIGVLGIELGADLVLRSASTDPQIKSILAFVPYLTMKVVDSGLVTRIRRRRLPDWAKLVEQLASLAAAQQLAGRQVRIVFGGQDRLIEVDEAVEMLRAAGLGENVTIMEDAKHDEIIVDPAAIALTRRWFSETL